MVTRKPFKGSLHPRGAHTGKFVEKLDVPAWLSTVSGQLLDLASGGTDHKQAQDQRVHAATRATMQGHSLETARQLARPGRTGKVDRTKLRAQVRGLDDDKLAQLRTELGSKGHPDAVSVVDAELARRAGATAKAPKAKPSLAERIDQDGYAKQIRAMSDDKLADEFVRISRQPSLTAHDEAAIIAIADEMGRRDNARHADTISTEQAHQDARIDALVARGYSYRDAYAEVHGLDSDVLDRQERASLVDAQRAKGETREQALRRLYAEHVHLQYLAAEQASNGHLLTPAARAQGIAALSLFSGPSARANKHASDELKEFWRTHPRVTYAEFKSATLARPADAKAAERARQAARTAEVAQPGDRGQKRGPRKKPTSRGSLSAPERQFLVGLSKEHSGIAFSDEDGYRDKATRDRLAELGYVRVEPAGGRRKAIHITTHGRTAAAELDSKAMASGPAPAQGVSSSQPPMARELAQRSMTDLSRLARMFHVSSNAKDPEGLARDIRASRLRAWRVPGEDSAADMEKAAAGADHELRRGLAEIDAAKPAKRVPAKKATRKAAAPDVGDVAIWEPHDEPAVRGVVGRDGRGLYVEWPNGTGGSPRRERMTAVKKDDRVRFESPDGSPLGGSKPPAKKAAKAAPSAPVKRLTAADRAQAARVASAFHQDWQKTQPLLGDGTRKPKFKTTTDRAWIQAHGTDQVDIANTSYADLPDDWQQENRDAAEVVQRILKERGGTVDLSDEKTRLEVGDQIHNAWLSRHGTEDWVKESGLDVPFAELPRSEQDKDLDQLKVAMAALAPAKKATPRKAAGAPPTTRGITSKVEARRSGLIGVARSSAVGGNNPAAEEVARMQGFDAKPKVGDAKAVDAVIAAGGIELWRGGDPASIDAMRSGNLHYGGGFFGSGYYSSVGRGAAEDFSGARGHSEPGHGAVVRMALHPDAKVVGYDDLDAQYKSFEAKDPQLAKAIDRNGYAAMLGYDAVRVPAKYGDGTASPVDQLIVLNRSKLTVDRDQEHYATGDLLTDAEFADMVKWFNAKDAAQAKADREASKARRNTGSQTTPAKRSAAAAPPSHVDVRRELVAAKTPDARKQYLESLGLNKTQANALAKALGARQNRGTVDEVLDNIVRYFDTGPDTRHHSEPPSAPAKKAAPRKAANPGGLFVARPGHPGLTAAQKAAVQRYTNSDLVTAQVNDILRQGKPHTALIRRIDEALAGSQTTEPMVTYRGMAELSGHGREGGVQRALGLSGSSLPDNLVGHEWTERAFTSTTHRRGIAEVFSSGPNPVILEIRVPAGTHAVARPGGEEEVLLDRGLTYRVVGDRIQTQMVGISGDEPLRKRVLEVEVVPKASGREARQAEIKAARQVSDVAAEVHELVGNGASPAAIRHRLDAEAQRTGIDTRRLQELADNPDALKAAADRMAEAAGLRRVGDVHPAPPIPFDRRNHSIAGPDIEQGRPVDVLRPTHVATLSTGEKVNLGPAKVKASTRPLPGSAAGGTRPAKETKNGVPEPAGTVRAEGYSSARNVNLRVVADGNGGYVGERQERGTGEWHFDGALGTGNTPKDITSRMPRGQWKMVAAPKATPPEAAPAPPAQGGLLAEWHAQDQTLSAAPAGLDRRTTNLTQAQRTALRYYQGAPGVGINAALYRPPAQLHGSTKRTIAAIDSAIDGSRLTDDVEVWRGIRGADRVFGRDLDGDLTGHEWTEPAFLSTSASQRVAAGFASDNDGPPALLRIRVPKGTGAVQVSRRDHQGELLLQRGLRLRVTADHGTNANGQRVLDVDVVPAAEAPANPDGLDDMEPHSLRSYAQEYEVKVSGRTDDQIKADLRKQGIGSPAFERAKQDAEDAAAGAEPAVTPAHLPSGSTATSTRVDDPAGEPGLLQVLPEAQRGEPGDGKYRNPDGTRGPWGRFGASGLLLRHVGPDGQARYLLGRRSTGVENGGTWAFPGGAKDENESDYQGAARETAEELGLTDQDLSTARVNGTHTATTPGGWHYTSVAATVPTQFTPKDTEHGWETDETRWMTADEIAELDRKGELHPALAGGQLQANVLSLFPDTATPRAKGGGSASTSAPAVRRMSNDFSGGVIPVIAREKADAPIHLPNHGSDQGLVHLDSALGSLWNDLYHDQREPNSFINEIAILGDRSGNFQISFDDVLDRLRELKTQAADQAVANRIQEAIDSIDSPRVPVPEVPDTVPDVVKNYLADLAEIPTARRTGRLGGHDTDKSVLDQQAELIRRIDAGEVDRHRALDLLRARHLHESTDGATHMWRLADHLVTPKIVTGYERGPDGTMQPVEEDNPNYRIVRDWLRDAHARRAGRPTSSSPESKPPATDKRGAARAAYQAVVDARPYATAGAELAELLDKKADNKVIAEHIRAIANPGHPDMEEAARGGNGDKIRRDLEAVATAFDRGDDATGKRLMLALLKQHNLSTVGGEPGNEKAFNPDVHEGVGGDHQTGDRVRVVRPGVSLRRGPGDDVQLSRALVRSVPTAPAPALAAPASPAAPPAAQGTSREVVRADLDARLAALGRRAPADTEPLDQAASSLASGRSKPDVAKQLRQDAKGAQSKEDADTLRLLANDLTSRKADLPPYINADGTIDLVKLGQSAPHPVDISRWLVDPPQSHLVHDQTLFRDAHPFQRQFADAVLGLAEGSMTRAATVKSLRDSADQAERTLAQVRAGDHPMNQNPHRARIEVKPYLTQAPPAIADMRALADVLEQAKIPARKRQSTLGATMLGEVVPIDESRFRPVTTTTAISHRGQLVPETFSHRTSGREVAFGTGTGQHLRPGLNGAENRALDLYTVGVVADGLNGSLRRGRNLHGTVQVKTHGSTHDVDLDQVKVDLDAAIAASELTQDAELWRGTTVTKADLDRLVPGAIYHDNGYLSTSTDEEKARGIIEWRRSQGIPAGRKPVLFKILAPAGTHAALGHEAAREALLGRGQDLRVVRVDHSGETPVVVMEAIAPPKTGAVRGQHLIDDFDYDDLVKYTPESPRIGTVAFVGSIAGDDRRSDGWLADIQREQGFDGHPQVVSPADMDAAVAGGAVELWRGIRDNDKAKISATDLAEQYRSGAVEPSPGTFGSGTYSSSRRAEAEMYAGMTGPGAGGHTMLRIALRRDARVISYADLLKLQPKFAGSAGAEKLNRDQEAELAAIDPADTAAVDAVIAKYSKLRAKQPSKSRVTADMGRLAALLGYDAIVVPPGYRGGKGSNSASEYVILNRTATMVEEEPTDRPAKGKPALRAATARLADRPYPEGGQTTPDIHAELTLSGSHGLSPTALDKTARALRFYRSSTYRKIAAYLRGDDAADTTLQIREAPGAAPTREPIGEHVAFIDQLLDHAPLSRPVEVWRGIQDPAKVFGPNWRPDGDMTGVEWAEHSYSSTSADPSVGQMFGSGGVLMRLHVPAGVGAVQLSGWATRQRHNDEAELLLQRGLQMRVIGDHVETIGYGVDGKPIDRRVLEVQVEVIPE